MPSNLQPFPVPDSVNITGELARRGSRPADFEAENRALASLMQELASSSGNMLQKLVETALALCGAESAGISLLEEDKEGEVFRWRALTGKWSAFLGSTIPREGSLCGEVLDRDCALLLSNPERHYPFPPAIRPPVVEALLAPFHVAGKPAGTIWVIAHDQGRKFDGEDLRLMTSLSRFAATAYQLLQAHELEVQGGVHERRELAATQQLLARQAADLIERKRAEEALRASEDRLRKIFEYSNDAIFLLDPAGDLIREANPRACAMFGYSREEILVTPISRFHPRDLAEFQAFIEGVHAEGHGWTDEFACRAKDGRFVASEISASTVRLDGTVCILAILRDITDRKRAEEELAEGVRQKDALYQLADRLHRTKSIDDVYDAALQAITGALQCARASILLFDDAGVMRFVGWRGLSEAYRKAVEGHSPWRADERNPEPICIDDVEAAELDHSLKATIKAEGIGAAAFIPLVSQGRLIGKFMTYFDGPHAFGDEIELSLTIARQLAFGIERKRAEEALRENERRFRPHAFQPGRRRVLRPRAGAGRGPLVRELEALPSRWHADAA
jgi:PAS domain S-box-containing protein